jgi:hypothetical protein
MGLILLCDQQVQQHPAYQQCCFVPMHSTHIAAAAAAVAAGTAAFASTL